MVNVMPVYSRKAVEDVERTGKICVLDLELQGVRSIKNASIDAKFILIKAPSLKVLVRSSLCRKPSPFQEDRLRLRGTETEETLKKRLKHAQEDANAGVFRNVRQRVVRVTSYESVSVAADPTLFDRVIINDDLERAYGEFLEAIREELDYTQRHTGQQLHAAL